MRGAVPRIGATTTALILWTALLVGTATLIGTARLFRSAPLLPPSLLTPLRLLLHATLRLRVRTDFRAGGTIAAALIPTTAAAASAVIAGPVAIAAASTAAVRSTRLPCSHRRSRSSLGHALRSLVTSPAAAIAATPAAAAARLVVEVASPRHVELLAVEHDAFANRRPNLRAARTNSEYASSGMMKDFDLDLVAAHPKLVERDLDRFVDCLSLCFDSGGHAASYLLPRSDSHCCVIERTLFDNQ